MLEARAAVLRQIGRPMAIERIAIGPLQPGDVLVKVAAASLCHTDLEVIEGQLALPLPAVLGHETAGHVAALGEGVTSLARRRPGGAVLEPALRPLLPLRARPADPLRALPGERPEGAAFRRPPAAGLRRWRHAAPVDVSRRLLRIRRRPGAAGGARAGGDPARPRLPARLRRHDRLRRRDACRADRVGRDGDGDRHRRGRARRRAGCAAGRRRADHRGRSQPGAAGDGGARRGRRCCAIRRRRTRRRWRGR